MPLYSIASIAENEDIVVLIQKYTISIKYEVIWPTRNESSLNQWVGWEQIKLNGQQEGNHHFVKGIVNLTLMKQLS